jgi:hypothetical protein
MKTDLGAHMADREYLIPMERFDSADYIETRVSHAPLVAGPLRTTLKYLYLLGHRQGKVAKHNPWGVCVDGHITHAD